MKYMGSKNRLAKELAPIIQSYITKETKGYLEPFVGGANMIDKIDCSKKYGCDINEYLIAFLDALSKGYEPPKNLSEMEYEHIKLHKEEYEKKLLGYAGFQLSFGAMWFSSYRKDSEGKRKYDEEAYKNVKKQAPLLKDIIFKSCSFQDINKNISNHVIYCDPPYINTAKYSVGEFNHNEYYDWCREMAKNNIVLCSEYWMPDDFECIWEKETKVNLSCHRKSNDKSNKRTEKLFILKGG